MSRSLPGGDTLPWYRQFWPWFLALLPASVVVASLLTVYIASRGADDLVVDEYYKDGLAINRRLERQQRAQALGLSTRLHFSGNTVGVTLSGPVADPELQLSLAHPLEADRDLRVTLARIGPQSYEGALAHPVAPHWHWALEPQREGGWRLDGTVQAEDFDDARRD